MKEIRSFHLFIILFFSLQYCIFAQPHNASQLKTSRGVGLGVVTEIPVGVILDLGSRSGKTFSSCISMAVSDFYALNSGYKTRMALHTRDSKGESLQTLSAALDLMNKNRIQAIIGPDTFLEAKLLAEFGEKAKLPVLSFAPRTASSTEYQFLVEIAQDEATQAIGIAKVVESFKWRDVILIYEDNDTGRRMLPYFFDSFLEKNIRVSYRCPISSLAVDDQIFKELYKLMKMRTTILVVHASHSLATRLFSKAKELRMMKEGYAWIVSDWTMNQLNSIDSEVILESMQGVLGFKSHIPVSRELRNFTSRWIKEYRSKNPSEEGTGLDVFSIWAYDAIWALAKAVEKVWMLKTPKADKQGKEVIDSMNLENIRSSQNGMELLRWMLRIRFKGLSGDFELVKGRQDRLIYEIVNVVGNGETRVGVWALQDGLSKENKKIYPSSVRDLKAIIWPGHSTNVPKGWIKKLRIGVPGKALFKDLVKVVFDAQINSTIVTGFCIDIFEAAIKALPYEVAYEYILFHGHYTDLIYQVHLRNFDAAVGDITITANRSLYVDFTLPYTDLGVGLLAPIDNNNMWIFLKPLDVDLWKTIIGFLFVTGIVIWVIEHPINQEFQGSLAQQIGIVVWFSFSTLVSAQREKLQSHLSRFISTVWVLLVLILTSSYTAILSSFLTAQQIQLATKGESIGYEPNSIVRGAIINTKNFENSLLREYYSVKDFVDDLSHGTIHAVVGEIIYAKILLGKYNDIFAMSDSIQSTTNGFGFVFQKGSPFVPEVSTQIARLREEGMLKLLENKWFKSESSSMKEGDVMSKPKVLTLDNFRGLFFISAISLALALLIFFSCAVKEKLHVNRYIPKILAGGKLAIMMKHLFYRNTSGVHELIPRMTC